MWLINTSTLELEAFFDDSIPPYAILSHTWRDGELTFQDMQNPNPAHRAAFPGFEKVRRTCEIALSEELIYAWVDTCCIDKSSSAELAEAINSMFRWYQHAHCCYAYLSDVTAQRGDPLPASRWFTRGWTLQELLAPSKIIFYNAEWSELGSSITLAEHITRQTGIEKQFLSKSIPISNASVAKRMSWASARQTTRTEDTAYCLLGIFDVNMPMIYGEGKQAFRRLQEEILRKSQDFTILTWGILVRTPGGTPGVTPEGRDIYHTKLSSPKPRRGVLAESPADFRKCGDFIMDELSGRSEPFSQIGQTIRVMLPLDTSLNRVTLPCRISRDYTSHLAINLDLDFGAHQDRVAQFRRTSNILHLVTHDEIAALYTPRHMDLAISAPSSGLDIRSWFVPVSIGRYIFFRTLPLNHYISDVFPPEYRSHHITDARPSGYGYQEDRFVGRRGPKWSDDQSIITVTLSCQDSEDCQIDISGTWEPRIIAVRSNDAAYHSLDHLTEPPSKATEDVQYGNIYISVNPCRKAEQGSFRGASIVPIDVTSRKIFPLNSTTNSGWYRIPLNMKPSHLPKKEHAIAVDAQGKEQ